MTKYAKCMRAWMIFMSLWVVFMAMRFATHNHMWASFALACAVAATIFALIGSFMVGRE